LSSRMVLELDVDPPETAPSRALDYAGRLVACFTTTPLFAYPKWGEPTSPVLLSSAESSNGGRTWTFFLRPNATWSSGAPFGKDDLVRLLSPVSKESSRAAARFLRREIASVEGFRKSAVRIQLHRPMPYLPEVLSSDSFMGPFAYREDTVSGPYKLVARRAGRVLGLTRNTTGFHQYSDGPDEVYFVVTQSPEDGVRLFNAGLLDATCNPNLPQAALSQFRNSPNLRLGQLAMAGVLIPLKPSMVDEVGDSIRRDKICSEVDAGLTPLHNLMDLFSEDAAVDLTNATDFAPKCKRVAQFPKDKAVLAYANFAPNDKVAERIACDLSERLGATIETRSLRYAEFLSELENQTADFIYTLIQPTLPEPLLFLDQITSLRGRNGHCPTPPDELHEASFTTRLAWCRSALLNEAHRCPLIPIVRHTSKCLTARKAQSLVLSPEGLLRPQLNLGS
jgi:MarR-like DNA-binding transcriptional regulator SgrR of sgrS sRNA